MIKIILLISDSKNGINGMRASVTLLVVLLLLLYSTSQAQRIKISGIVYDSLSMHTVSGATILVSTGEVEMTDESGAFSFITMPKTNSFFRVSAIGYQQQNVVLGDLQEKFVVKLCPIQTTLANVVVTGTSINPYKVLDDTGIYRGGPLTRITVSNVNPISSMI